MVLSAPEAPSAMEAFMWNMGLVLMLVVMFYVLLIRPQQRRFKEHSEMLRGLKKGDTVVTGGGLIGVLEKIEDGAEDAVVDLGNGLKVTVMRDQLQKKSKPKSVSGSKTAASSVEKKASDKKTVEKK
ncbi:MAG: preprotein translocase subunit YajC [Alphaproteobacteria bacterium]|nr:preprotein translocase subunit YajC [Alphaproteobacteria bacterium]